MIRRLLPAGLTFLAVLAATGEAHAQLAPGIHVARANDVGGGANGVGASVELSFPLAPVDVFVGGDYFFPDCGVVDCGLWGGSADVHFKMPLPVLTPYGAVGIVYRKSTADDVGSDATGFGIGAGVNLGTVLLGAYLEGRYEFVGQDDQMVFRLGIRF